MRPINATLRALLSSLLLTACVTVNSGQELAPESPATVCDVLDHVATYADRATTTLSARVVTDFTHRTAIGDDRCPGRLLPFGKSHPDTVGRQAFFNAVHGARATPDAIIRITVIGNVEQRPGQVPNVIFNAREFLSISVTNGATVTDYPIDRN